MYDIAVHIVRRTRTSIDTTAGDILSDTHLDRIPRAAPAAFIMLYKATLPCTRLSTRSMYHDLDAPRPGAPAAVCHGLAARPWMTTSIVNFWSFRWYRFCQHTFAYGARPGGAVFGSQARCSAHWAYPPCCNVFTYGGSGPGEGRGSAAWCVLRSHERPFGVGARLETHDRHAGAGFLGLHVDSGLNYFGGHVNARWVDTTPPLCMRQVDGILVLITKDIFYPTYLG